MSAVALPECVDQELKVRTKQWERTARYQLVRRGTDDRNEVIGANLTAEAAKALAVKLSKYSTDAIFVVESQLPGFRPNM